MTAVATLSTATAADLPGLHTPGSALLWVAAAVWLLALAGLLHHLDPALLRAGGRRGPIGGDRRSG